MSEKKRPALRAIEGARDAELRRVGIYGTNSELAAAIERLQHRATLQAVTGDKLPVPADAEKITGSEWNGTYLTPSV